MGTDESELGASVFQVIPECHWEGSRRLARENTWGARWDQDEMERANFRRRRDKLLAKAEAERDTFVNEDDN